MEVTQQICQNINNTLASGEIQEIVNSMEKRIFSSGKDILNIVVKL
ncbi:hypothetical protein [Candidatus Orientia mediorientalis]|nr:hypothetical protein [Candidatus Orientia mediorientalis]